MPAQPIARWRGHRLIPPLLFACVSLLYLGHASLYGGWINDDAGISFTYARNLARGDGLVLNPGGERVEGYSNPLWVFLLSATFLAGLFDPVATPKFLSIIAVLASFVLLGRISRRIFGRSASPLHLLPALSLACCVPFVAWSISGLENGLYVFLILLAIDLRLGELEEAARPPVSGLVLFLVAITRPEGVLYFGAALAHGFAVALTRRRVAGRDVAWVAAFALPFLAYHIWHYLYFADLLPNTYYAKMQAGGPSQHMHEELLDIRSPGWRYLLKGLRDQNLRWLLPAATMILLLWSFRRRSAGAFLVLFFVLSSAFYPVFVGGDWMGQYRFLTPLFALAYLVMTGALLLAVGALTARPRVDGTHAARAAAGMILVAVVMAILILPSAALLDGPVKPPSVSFAGIAARGLKFKALAEKLFIEDGSLLDPDLGGTSYASGLRLIDLGALADVHIARHEYDQRYFGRYIFVEQRPTFIHTHCVWSRRSQIHQSLDLRRDYLPLWERPCESSCCPGSIDGEYIRREIFVDPAPRIDRPLDVTFDGGPTLVGYRLEPRVVPPGGAALLTTWWTVSSPVAGPAGFGLTLVAPDGSRVAVKERPFTHGIYPPDRWRQDETIRERDEIPIPMTAAEGTHEIEIRLTGSDSPVTRVVAVIEVGRPDRDSESRPGSRPATPVESTIRDAESLTRAGDLRRATDLLMAARTVLPGERRLVEALSNLSALWYRRGEEILEAGDSFLRWGEAMSAFQSALACRPSNAFARKQVEALRSRDYVERVYGGRIREAQEGSTREDSPARLLMAIEDEGFREETDEILRGSAPIRERLAAEGTLASLSLLHRACALLGDAGKLAAAQTRVDAIAPSHIDLGGQLVYLGNDFEPAGQGRFRITWWFQATRRMTIGYKIFLHAFPEDLATLPADRAQYKFVNLDHFPGSGTDTWMPGSIVRHVFSGRVAPGAYRFVFGFFESGGDSKLVDSTRGSSAVEIGSFDVR